MSNILLTKPVPGIIIAVNDICLKLLGGGLLPRPCKRRRICAEPSCGRFGPLEKSATQVIEMTLDEFETIRLIDLEGMGQQQCAEQMNVARTTVQAIYESARYKLAQCLVGGMELKIGGGDYEVCGGSWAGCGCKGRCRFDSVLPMKTAETERKKTMKIAVTYANGLIFQHFGHCEAFKIYEVQDGVILSSEVVSAVGSGHGALAGFLKNHGVDALVCGGIGGGARNALAEAGIALYPGVSGSADDSVKALLEGKLIYNPGTVCGHHHEGGHNCGEHTCSEDKHGCGGNH